MSALVVASAIAAAFIMPLRLVQAQRPALAHQRVVPPRALDGEEQAWPRDLTRHVIRGIGLAVREAQGSGGARAGVIAAARIAKLVANELVFFPLTMLPFAVRTTRYRAASVELVESPNLEIYTASDETARRDGPLVLFVHGGSWGQGSPWQYALLARRLLDEAGASRVAIARYRLFPAGDVDDMLADVEAALAWCEEQQRAAAADQPDAPRLRVVLAAQSAGAHLCALLLARRGWAAAEGTWQPDRLVMLSGVYDIALHFAHERTRLVHWLSPMWLAMIGRTGGVNSLSTMLDAATGNASSRVSAADLAAIGISKEALERDSLVSAPAGTSSVVSPWQANELMAWAAASPTRVLRLRQLLEPRTLAWPPTIVLHALDDRTVPVSSARDFIAALQAVTGANVCRVRYSEQAGHGEIMLALMSRSTIDELPAIASDFVRACSLRE